MLNNVTRELNISTWWQFWHSVFSLKAVSPLFIGNRLRNAEVPSSKWLWSPDPCLNDVAMLEGREETKPVARNGMRNATSCLYSVGALSKICLYQQQTVNWLKEGVPVSRKTCTLNGLDRVGHMEDGKQSSRHGKLRHSTFCLCWWEMSGKTVFNLCSWGVGSQDSAATLNLFWKSIASRLLWLISFTQHFGYDQLYSLWGFNKTLYIRWKCEERGLLPQSVKKEAREDE